MSLDNSIILKEEIPILHGSCFYVPIHPTLLKPETKIDKNLARAIFPEAAEEWYADLVQYTKNLGEGKEKRQLEEVFLKRKPRIKRAYGKQMLDTLQWEDDLELSANGFACGLGISRNGGGMLSFDEQDSGCKYYVSFDSPREYIRFSKDKAVEFSRDGQIARLGNGREGTEVNAYASLNIDYYPGALFLRNWAILYLNEAIRQVSEKR